MNSEADIGYSTLFYNVPLPMSQYDLESKFFGCTLLAKHFSQYQVNANF